MSAGLGGPFVFVFLIVPSLSRRCFSGANDPRSRVPFGEAHDHQPVPDRVTDDQLTALARRVIGIVENLAQWVGEYGECLFERYSVILQVGFRLARVLFELRSHRIDLTLP